MTRTLVLCADGTCNAFGHSSSNVARLLEHIELHSAKAQVVCYDQGIGTRRGEHKRIEAFRDRLGCSGTLCLLPPPDDAWTRPWTWPSLIKSMTRGKGLDVNVGQLYETLATLYAPCDQLFLFGFSRGAFTVRALAGLTWRYGLPATGDRTEARARFAEAWPLFSDEFPDEDGVKAKKALQFRERYGQRQCPIHFLGLWDTVKSYGGLQPVMLPHLRHNPSVATVRHALALGEKRGWFEATTWGWLDSDQEKCAAVSRLAPIDIALIKEQDVVEVWFSGCHSDVGGGGRSDCSSSIALRWMLGEARHAGLKLNASGDRFLEIPGNHEKPEPTDSRTLPWKVIECKQRQAITNAGLWPMTFTAKRGASLREPLKSVRGKTIWYHESVRDLSRFATVPEGVTLKPRITRRTLAAL
jgi:uncharacterized protein (DUF2235 family)